jgi:hypothetical protein
VILPLWTAYSTSLICIYYLCAYTTSVNCIFNVVHTCKQGFLITRTCIINALSKTYLHASAQKTSDKNTHCDGQIVVFLMYLNIEYASSTTTAHDWLRAIHEWSDRDSIESECDGGLQLHWFGPL